MKNVLDLPSNFHQSPSTTGLDGYGYKPKSDILQLLFSQGKKFYTPCSGPLRVIKLHIRQCNFTSCGDYKLLLRSPHTC